MRQDERRVPSWTDRVVSREVRGCVVKCWEYQGLPVVFSDHRPVLWRGEVELPSE